MNIVETIISLGKAPTNFVKNILHLQASYKLITGIPNFPGLDL